MNTNIKDRDSSVRPDESWIGPNSSLAMREPSPLRMFKVCLLAYWDLRLTSPQLARCGLLPQQQRMWPNGIFKMLSWLQSTALQRGGALRDCTAVVDREGMYIASPHPRSEKHAFVRPNLHTVKLLTHHSR